MTDLIRTLGEFLCGIFSEMQQYNQVFRNRFQRDPRAAFVVIHSHRSAPFFHASMVRKIDCEGKKFQSASQQKSSLIVRGQ